ncbi:MAG: universal stress protein [Ottowia sp.]|nr:universal stress protein [Ottowia sp.]
MKVLLPVDGSLYTKKMLAYLTTHMGMFASTDNEFTVLTVQRALPPRARGLLDQQELASYYSEEAAKVLDPVLSFLQQNNIKATARAEIGSPGETIARCAAEGKYDLIVMGSHGNSALAGLVLGSVASKVLAACPSPVLLIR